MVTVLVATRNFGGSMAVKLCGGGRRRIISTRVKEIASSAVLAKVRLRFYCSGGDSVGVAVALVQLYYYAMVVCSRGSKWGIIDIDGACGWAVRSL